MAKRKLIFLTGWKYYNHALLRDCAPHEDTPIIINNKVIYPIKKVFQPLDKISIIHKVNSIMKMKKIRRSFREM